MIHNEGISTIGLILLLSLILFFAISYLLPEVWMRWLFLLLIIVFNGLILWFFRNPDRSTLPEGSELAILAPADGKLVSIEEVEMKEYFEGTRTRLSIFMSPLNVHVNRYPINGTIQYYKYHPGKYLVAWHPKSSEKNERTTVVIEHPKGEIMLRQIAGAVARRIVCYAEVGQQVAQGTDLGFIKFGSRVDIFLPKNTEIKVEIDQKIVGNQTKLAVWTD
ncbi:MAG TPA: phosphatidylserine decarboxylase family protein [Saprospiraceae bacterium]|nr:phosphatidylserine decarboxylase family protein [Saprospiraceae bacterium]